MKFVVSVAVGCTGLHPFILVNTADVQDFVLVSTAGYILFSVIHVWYWMTSLCKAGLCVGMEWGTTEAVRYRDIRVVEVG